MKFSKFKLNFTRKAVMFGVSKETQRNMVEWCVSNGFDLTKSYSGNDQKVDQFDFHVTLICSENEAFIEDKRVDIPPTEVKLEKFEVLGVDRTVPVIIVSKTESMLKQRTFFEDFYGLYDKWPDWKTHLSLSYNWFGAPNLEELMLPDFPVILDHITVAKMD